MHPKKSVELPIAAEAGDGPATRARLIAAAKRLFALKGFDGATVKELAELASVNVSLISYHFGGKEGLYRSCLEHFGKERLEVAQRMLQPVKNADELIVRLRMFIDEILGFHLDEPEVTQILHRECDGSMKIAADIFNDTFLNVFRTLAEFLKQAQKAGILRKKLDPQIMASSFFGMVVHFGKSDHVNQRFFGNSLRHPAYRTSVVDHILQVFQVGTLAVREPSKED